MKIIIKKIPMIQQLLVDNNLVSILPTKKNYLTNVHAIGNNIKKICIFIIKYYFTVLCLYATSLPFYFFYLYIYTLKLKKLYYFFFNY